MKNKKVHLCESEETVTAGHQVCPVRPTYHNVAIPIATKPTIHNRNGAYLECMLNAYVFHTMIDILYVVELQDKKLFMYKHGYPPASICTSIDS